MTEQARKRPTDGVRVLTLDPREKVGVDWSRIDLERRLGFSKEREQKEAHYASVRHELAMRTVSGRLRYYAACALRWLGLAK